MADTFTGKSIYFVGMLSNVIYSKDDFCILSMKVVSNLTEAEIKTDKKGCVVIKGYPKIKLEKHTEYVISSGEVENDNYGKQYSINSIKTNYKLETESEKRAFLSMIMPEQKFKLYCEAFKDDLLKPLKDGNVELIIEKVKGLGAKGVLKIIERYNNNSTDAHMLVKLQSFGLTDNEITKLSEIYHNLEKVYEVLTDNPYKIVRDIKGIGFKRADAIAMNNGVGEHDIRRTKGFVEASLYKEASCGSTKMSVDDLCEAIYNELGENYPMDSIVGGLQELEKEKVMWVSSDRDEVALNYYRNIEKKLAEKLYRMSTYEREENYDGWETSIKELERIQGWEYVEGQRKAIEKGLKSNVSFIIGSAGCVDKDTEYFNGAEWKKISEYIAGEKVLQYDLKTREASLIAPLRYVKIPEKTFYHFETKYGLNQTLSGDHRVIYETSKGDLRECTTLELIEKHNKSKGGFSGKILTTFNYNGKGLGLTDDEIRLRIAIMAEAHFNKGTVSTRCVIRLKKTRKQERLEMLLNNLGIEYKKRYQESTGFNIYAFCATNREKEFKSYWYEANKHQMEVIVEEITKWDGSEDDKGRRRYFSTNKCDVDFIQFACACCGLRGAITEDNRVDEQITGKKEGCCHKKVCYNLSITKRNKCSIGGFSNPENKTIINKIEVENEYKYCFTVPTSALILRREGKVFVTGNCGKTSVVSGIRAALGEEHKYLQTALSGKACENLQFATGKPAMTMHRFIYSMWSIKSQAKDCPDVVIIDEIGMCGIDLLWEFLAILPVSTKVFFLGDKKQLASIGAGSFLSDCMTSGVINIIELTEVHRQARGSGIITESIKVSEGKQLVSPNFIGEEVRGELKDFTLTVYDDKEESSKRILEKYKELLNEGISYEDIQVVVPMNSRGKISAFNVSNKIQKLLFNKDEKFIEKGSKESKYKLHVGDMVMNTKNNYATTSIDGEELIPIFNGDICKITKILDDGSVVVENRNKGEILVDKEFVINLKLSYACTCHKLQGSGFRYVLICIDYSAYVMLSREWLYTAITRAKKHCYMFAENNALRKSIRTSGVEVRNTFLTEFLKEEFNKNQNI